jgi:hypothetical protein
VDLPDLVPFLKALFAVLGKRPHQVDEVRLSFRTPEPWTDDFAIADRYDLLFARDPRPKQGEDVAGVGLRVVDRAIRSAIDLRDALAAIGELGSPLVVFALRDRITSSEGTVRTVIVGLQRSDDGQWRILRDWELIKLVNPMADKPRSAVLGVDPSTELETAALLADAEAYLERRLGELDLPFRLPAIETLACLMPARADGRIPQRP